jgi:hypothetical protein
LVPVRLVPLYFLDPRSSILNPQSSPAFQLFLFQSFFFLAAFWSPIFFLLEIGAKNSSGVHIPRGANPLAGRGLGNRERDLPLDELPVG